MLSLRKSACERSRPDCDPWSVVNIVLVLALGLAWLILASAPAAGESPHAGLGCAGCHAAGAKVSPQNATLLLASQRRHCGGCHEGAAKVSHPVGFTPERPLPPQFPLDWKGQFTCSTCHALHDEGPARLRGRKRGEALCLSCHPARFFDAMRDRGESLRASAHLDAVPGRGSRIDSYSLRCMDCHRDRASLPDPDGGMRGVPARFGGLANHPIGSDYQWAAIKAGYRPASALPAGMLLPEGKVSCLSCHEGYSRQHGKLVRPHQELCDACHDK